MQSKDDTVDYNLTSETVAWYKNSQLKILIWIVRNQLCRYNLVTSKLNLFRVKWVWFPYILKLVSVDNSVKIVTIVHF
jgi:hypothetical protein